jgi:hypothetical protein
MFLTISQNIRLITFVTTYFFPRDYLYDGKCDIMTNQHFNVKRIINFVSHNKTPKNGATE